MLHHRSAETRTVPYYIQVVYDENNRYRTESIIIPKSYLVAAILNFKMEMNRISNDCSWREHARIPIYKIVSV